MGLQKRKPIINASDVWPGVQFCTPFFLPYAHEIYFVTSIKLVESYNIYRNILQSDGRL